MTLLPGFDDFIPARSKAEVVARIYAVAGARPELLGPGSKEKKSALLALGDAAGIELDRDRRKTGLVRDLASALDVAWSDRFISVGETVTLAGLNALLQAASEHLVDRTSKPVAPEWLAGFADFRPARSKLEAVNRISALTGSGPQALGPGSKERKSVLVDMASAWFPELDVESSKHALGAALARRLDVPWPTDCVSTGYTITLDGLNTLLAGAEAFERGVAVPVESPIEREAAALLGALTSSLPSHWDGYRAIDEMREAEYANWRQSEWPGWYFEFRGLPALIDAFGGGPMRVGRTTFDYSLTIPWDLKCHSRSASRAVVLNDHLSLVERLAHGAVGFLMLTGDADLDPIDGDFTRWMRSASGQSAPPGGHSGKPRLRKRAFTPASIDAFVLRDLIHYESALLAGQFAVRGQGRQQSGASRPDKLHMDLPRARADYKTNVRSVVIERVELDSTG